MDQVIIMVTLAKMNVPSFVEKMVFYATLILHPMAAQVQTTA
jgi:hypothetical protein